MPKKLCSMFPGPGIGSDGVRKQYLYLVGGHDGSIKIGATRDPNRRMRTHRISMGENFAWAHVFPQSKSGHSEWSLKQSLAKIGRQVRRTEKFFGIAKQDAISLCREYLLDSLSEHERWAHSRAQRDAQDAAWQAFKAQYTPAALVSA